MKPIFMYVVIICLLVSAAGVVYAQQIEEPGEPPTIGGSPSPEPAPEKPAAPAPAPAEPAYENFSVGERWGTWALNCFVLPGLGSYTIMRDNLGGTVQLAVWGVGTTLTVIGIVRIFNAFRDFQNDVVDDLTGNSYNEGSESSSRTDPEALAAAFRDSLSLVIIAGAIHAANGIFNIARSITYDKPQPKVGSLADPNAWSLAIVPGRNGVEAVQLAYTLRF